jgi:sterol desaturase/sphingolipid hydroxylase (fatty acid hydroxylase superfamily)
MPKVEINNDDQPIRLFQSNFLEFFTHISPLAVLIIWIPVVVFFLYRGFNSAQQSYAFILIAYFLGLFFWTFAEYILHRFLFHFHPKSKNGEKINFLFHGIHHAQPKIKTRLVMPPIVSIPMAAIFYLFFSLIFSQFLNLPHWLGPLFSGFISGYIAYDMLHYATHHFRMRNGVWKFLKRHHMQHHYVNPGLQFGVSSPLWDKIFSTMISGT